MEQYTPEQVEILLFEAGEVRMRQRVPGCWPSGYRSGMPECLRDPEDVRYAETEAEPDQPTRAEVTKADLVENWIRQLPAETYADVRRRKILLDGMLTRPGTDDRVFSFSRLGALHGLHKEQVERVWRIGVDRVTVIANRSAAAVKVSTVARIRVASLRPLSKPCADTMARIRRHQSAELVLS